MSNSLTAGIRRTFFAVIVALSAATSFMYFVETFSLGRGLLPSNALAVLVNGSVGVLVLDVAAIAWLRIYLNGSDNNALRAIAVVGAAVAMAGSALTSLLYLVMASTAADTLGPELRQYTTWALAGLIVLHFVLVFLSGYKATSAQIDERTSDLMSQATEETLRLTEEYFRAEIPSLAQANARKLTDRLAGQFATMSHYEASRPVDRARLGSVGEPMREPMLPKPAAEPVLSAMPSANGHEPEGGSFLP